MAGRAPQAVAARPAVEVPEAPDEAAAVPWSWVAAIGAVLVAGSLWGFDRSLWLDEAFSLAPLHEPVRAVVDDRGSMAAYHALLWPLSQISEAPWFLRIPSLVASVAAVVLVVRGVAAEQGRRAAVTAGLVLATTWTIVSHAQEMRGYALGVLVVVVQWRLLQDGLRRDDPRRIRVWTALAVVGTFVHGLLILQVLAQVAAVELAGFDRAARRRVRAGAAAAVLPPGLLALTGAASLTPYQPELGLETVRGIVESLSGPGVLGLPVLAMAALGGTRLVAAARTATTPGDRLVALLPLAWAVLPTVALCAISVATPKMVPRYVLPSVVGMAILVGVGVAALPTRRIAAAVVAVVVTCLALHQVDGHQAGTGDWGGAAAHVADGAEPGDAVVFPRANRRPPFEAEWVRLGSPPDVEAINPDRPLREVRWLEDDAPVAEVVARAAEHERVWVVTEPFQSLDREQPVVDGLRDAGYRQVEEVDFGMNIAVRLYVRS